MAGAYPQPREVCFAEPLAPAVSVAVNRIQSTKSRTSTLVALSQPTSTAARNRHQRSSARA